MAGAEGHDLTSHINVTRASAAWIAKRGTRQRIYAEYTCAHCRFNLQVPSQSANARHPKAPSPSISINTSTSLAGRQKHQIWAIRQRITKFPHHHQYITSKKGLCHALERGSLNHSICTTPSPSLRIDNAHFFPVRESYSCILSKIAVPSSMSSGVILRP